MTQPRARPSTKRDKLRRQLGGAQNTINRLRQELDEARTAREEARDKLLIELYQEGWLRIGLLAIRWNCNIQEAYRKVEQLAAGS